MLSGAKHLQYTLENKQMQILRCAQDDTDFHLHGWPTGPCTLFQLVQYSYSGYGGCVCAASSVKVS